MSKREEIFTKVTFEIDTPRLVLKAPDISFGERFYEAKLDGYTESAKWLIWDKSPQTLDETTKECNQRNKDFKNKKEIYYFITDKTSSNVIGFCAFPARKAIWDVPQFSITYFIRESERGKGYIYEVIEAMKDLGFGVLKARKLEILCDEENIVSCKVAEKTGFEFEYTFTGGWLREDGNLPKVKVYSMFIDT